MPWWILQNRYVVTFGLIGLAALLWNVYIAFNDDGVIEGRVVAPDGRPVAGATVVLSERSLLVTAPRARATTDEAGRFAFADHGLYRLYLEARKDGLGVFEPLEFRLYFRGQNLWLDEPLRLVSEAAQ